MVSNCLFSIFIVNITILSCTLSYFKASCIRFFFTMQKMSFTYLCQCLNINGKDSVRIRILLTRNLEFIKRNLKIAINAILVKLEETRMKEHCKKVKLSALQAMKAHGVHIYTATALGRDRVASPTHGRFYTRGKPRTHFIGG